MKRPFLIVFLLLALLGMPVSAPAQEIEKPKIDIGIGTMVVQYLPLPAAYANGFFKDEGLTVQIQNFNAGGSVALKSLVGGSSDAVVGFYDHTLQMQSQGKDVRCVILLSDIPGVVIGIRKDLAAQISGVAGLKGRRVGISAFGSATEFHLLRILQGAGLTKADVVLVQVGQGATAVAALEQKTVDAVVVTDPTATIMEQRNLLQIFVNARTSKDTIAAFGGRYPSVCLYMMGSFIDKNPRTVQRLVNAFARSLDWIARSTPEQIVTAVESQYAAGDRDTFVSIIKNSKEFPRAAPFNVTDLERVRDTIATFDEKIRDAKIDVRNTFTNAFVEKIPAAKP